MTLEGANAVHGIVNVLSPTIGTPGPTRLSIEGGADGFRRLRLAAVTGSETDGYGAWGSFTHDDGFRAASPVEDGKLSLLHQRHWRGGDLRLRFAGTVLNQETAGFVRGLNAYRDPQLARSNPNPEAFRDAWSTRLSALWSRIDDCERCSSDLRLVLRRSQMQFLQHFLLGKPLERNGQDSVAISGLVARPWGAATWRAGLDLELADGSLRELQDGTDARRQCRRARHPPGRQALRLPGRLADGGRIRGVERASRPAAGGQRLAARRPDALRLRQPDARRQYRRRRPQLPRRLPVQPASRSQRQLRQPDAAPGPQLARHAADDRLYVAAASGFRPPESTELYRLQRQQRSADLDSERLTSVEAGWRHESPRQAWSLAAYAMRKSNVILRDADGLNVSDGRTTHRGIEYEWRLLLGDGWRLDATGSLARHRYDFSRSIDGGETIVAGRDVDTAPRQLHRAALAWQPAAGWSGELEVLHVGPYFADAANLNRYPGHTLANLRIAWRARPTLRATLRVTNLADRAYADRADFAQGDWRYFPGRGRSAFLELEYLHAAD